ncbi:hypothetical protein DFH08DRAFT_622134, partial [Mycena albidolilacea]
NSTTCALQTCLNKNTYKPEKCDERLHALYMCCQKMYNDLLDKDHHHGDPVSSL